MPTEPNENFIPLSIENVAIQEILNQYSGALEEVRNFGSHVAQWCSTEIHGGEEHAPIMLSFRHIFELIDAISVLVRNSCIEPCKILLRSVFESVLTVKYILEKETEKRGLAFMTCLWHQRINYFRKMNPKDEMHKQFLAKKRKDKYMKDIPLPDIPDVEQGIRALERHLASPKYIESEKEYQRLKSIIKRTPKESVVKKNMRHSIFLRIKKAVMKRERRDIPIKLNWYSMHGGPKNIEELSGYFKTYLEYELLYREWSGIAHGINIILENIEVIDRDTASISQIRIPGSAFEVTTTAINFAPRGNSFFH